MAALTKYVDTAAAGTDSGDDWTNAYVTMTQLGTYIASKDLVTDGDTLTVYFRGGQDTTTLTGNQTNLTLQSSATNWIKFLQDGTNTTTAPSVTKIDTGRYYQESTYGTGIAVTGGYIEIDGMQVIVNIATAYRNGITMSYGGGSGEMHLRNSVVQRTGSGTDQSGISYGGSSTGTIKNCVVYDFAGTGGVAVNLSSTGTAPTFVAANNTIHGATTGLKTSYQDTDAINNLLANCTTDFNGTFSNTGGDTDYNGYEGATAPSGGTNTNDVGNTSVTFANEAGDDFTLNSSDTAFHTAGIGTTNANVLSTDIFGTARASGTCSMGAVEYVASGSVPLFARHLLNQLGS